VELQDGSCSPESRWGPQKNNLMIDALTPSNHWVAGGGYESAYEVDDTVDACFGNA
jgi:hypothetical protein